MINDIPKISVIIICYKQEELIKRAINSLLVQRDYIYEICVSDDGSPDRTWDVLQEYDKQYPGLFKLHQNHPNVGIFENIEYTWTMPTGDIVYRLAGDDECGEGWLKRVVEYIQSNKIDYKNELFCIYGDYKQVNPDGSSVLYTNHLVKKVRNPLKLKVRQLVSNRSACFSVNIMKKYIKVSEKRSYAVELTMDAELQYFTLVNYYIPQCGNIYYAGIGVSKNIPSEESVNSAIGIYDHFLAFLHKEGVSIDKKDIAYIKFIKEYRMWSGDRNLNHLFYMISWYIQSIDLSLGIYGLQLQRMAFAVKRLCSV